LPPRPKIRSGYAADLPESRSAGAVPRQDLRARTGVGVARRPQVCGFLFLSGHSKIFTGATAAFSQFSAVSPRRAPN